MRMVGGTHLRVAHGWTLEAYREAFQLRQHTPTCSRELSSSYRASAGSRVGRDGFAEPPCFLGIDGGGTKTHAVITTASYKIIGEGFSGASNPVRVGFDLAVAHVSEAVEQACSQAHITPQDLAAGCAAIAGISHPIHHHTMKKGLTRRLGVDHLELVTDARAALEGALDGKPGVVLIAGTGSIAMGINEARTVERSGGWGPTLGDEGSGYDIARQALKAVAASFDGRAPRTVTCAEETLYTPLR